MIEQARSFFVSLGLTLFPIASTFLGFAASEGHITSPADTFGFLGTHWWVIVVGLILNPGPYFRARQTYLKQNLTADAPQGVPHG